MSEQVSKFGVQAAAFSPAIHVGRMRGATFASKEDATDMVLAAVAQYVQRNFDGGMRCDFPRLGIVLDVKVTAANPAPEETA